MRIILYTGKGGVGKTSAAVATACHLAQEGKRVLIMSTDQAHSLSDSFEQPIGREETKLSERLSALEIDAEQESEAAWGKLQGYLKELLTSRANGGLETEELLVFPGLEELFSMLKILEIQKSGAYDVLIVDCAPTGETMALLRFPELFGSFLRQMLPKKKKLARIAGPAVTKLTKIPMPELTVFDELETLTNRLEEMQQLMQDKTKVSIRIVTTPERIVIREAKRNFTWLHMYGYNVDAILVNRVYPAAALDGYFSRLGNLQEEGMKEIRESFSPIPIYTLELKRQELKSLPMLSRAAEELFGTTDASTVLFQDKIFEIKQTDNSCELLLYLPFAKKEEIELSQAGEELILGIQTMTRRFLLPEPVKGCQVTKADYENGVLKLRMEAANDKQDEL